MEESEIKNLPTRQLTPEEFEALNKDLVEVLKKHNCEMGVVASISMLKYVEPVEQPKNNGTNTDNTTKETGEEAPKTD